MGGTPEMVSAVYFHFIIKNIKRALQKNIKHALHTVRSNQGNLSFKINVFKSNLLNIQALVECKHNTDLVWLI